MEKLLCRTNRPQLHTGFENTDGCFTQAVSALFTTSREKKERYDRLVSRMEKQEAKLSILSHHSQSILWLEMTGAAACRVCALPKQLDYLLLRTFEEDIPFILTSGTLSVGGDFSHFKRDNGIAMAESRRVFETSKASL